MAGRTGQEYNQRKGRKGAYWEDRYHATPVESGDHLARCMVYIDTNIVRAGVVNHPSKWLYSGYNEIQSPRRKNILINYDKLRNLFGASSYEQLRRGHEGWVNEYLEDGKKDREEEWTDSIAVGNRPFVEKVKELLGFRAKGRKVIKGKERYQVREAPTHYNVLSGVENENIGLINTYFWDVNL